MSRFSSFFAVAAVSFLLGGIACTKSATPPSGSGGITLGGASGGGGTSTAGGTTGLGGSASGGITSGITSIVGTGGTRDAGAGIATGGNGGTGGSIPAATGGSRTGGTASGGAVVGTGGVAGRGGATVLGGSITAGGTGSGGVRSGGAGAGGTPTGGTPASGGATGTGGASTVIPDAGATASCSGTAVTLNANPFNCKFGWGAPGSGTNDTYLNHVAVWVGGETNAGMNSWSATGTNSGSNCWGCATVKSAAAASSTAMAVFYAYFIGYQACLQGNFCDCNTHSPPNLCTNGAQFIRDNQAQIVNAYGQYAKTAYALSPNKPVIWWLEGDFIQYTAESGTQTTPLTMAEAGAVARQITCAIKANEPNAIVAMNHSPWAAQTYAQTFWQAQPLDVLDLIWVQGAGDADKFVNNGNQAFETFSWLHTFTGKKLMAETSYAGSGVSDRWTTTTAANINARIASGVISVLVNNPPSSYQSTLTTLNAGLDTTCN